MGNGARAQQKRERNAGKNAGGEAKSQLKSVRLLYLSLHIPHRMFHCLLRILVQIRLHHLHAILSTVMIQAIQSNATNY